MNPETMRVMTSSAKQDWATPRDLFQRYDKTYGFDLDVCATADNACVPRFFSPADDGLAQPWFCTAAWCNPPYSRGLGQWLAKAHAETQAGRAKTVVCLVPSRTDTRWFHDLVLPHAFAYDFLRGRVTFVGAPAPAPFPSLIVVFRAP